MTLAHDLARLEAANNRQHDVIARLSTAGVIHLAWVAVAVAWVWLPLAVLP